jgi:hypothetical protein
VLDMSVSRQIPPSLSERLLCLGDHQLFAPALTINKVKGLILQSKGLKPFHKADIVILSEIDQEMEILLLRFCLYGIATSTAVFTPYLRSL